MKDISVLGKDSPPLKNTVVAIGIFDGVHVGHRSLIEKMVAVGRKKKLKTVVLTFHPHPAQVLRNVPINYLTSLRRRIDLIKSLGVDKVWVIEFTKKFARLSPKEFVQEYLIKRLGVKEVFVGDDFRFGENRTGDVVLFEEMGKKFSFKVHHVHTIKKIHHKISSSWLRELILTGKLKQASRLLGRLVSVSGKVIQGRQLGKILGFPTANLQIEGGILPPNGAYIVQVFMGSRKWWGISNIGFRPSVSSLKQQPLLEVHLLDFHRNIYQKELIVEFLKKIRNEKKFPSVDRLVSQIKKDEKSARRYLNLPEK